METSELIAIGAGILAVVIAFLAYHRTGQPLTVQGVTETLQAAKPLAEEIREVAEVAVASAQQLKESGKLDGNDAAFQHAVDHVERWYNSIAHDVDLDPLVIANAVEGAYYWLKRAQAVATPKPVGEITVSAAKPATELRRASADALKVAGDKEGVSRFVVDDSNRQTWPRADTDTEV